jgi:hypothetical protein
VPAYVLIAIVKKAIQLDASLYTLLQILSVSVFERNHISQALRVDATRTIAAPVDKQMSPFDF